jgi:hypothetical protein
LPALAFASQSPYPGWQNVVNSRNVMRNLECPTVHNLDIALKSERRNKKPEKFGTAASVPPLRILLQN